MNTLKSIWKWLQRPVPSDRRYAMIAIIAIAAAVFGLAGLNHFAVALTAMNVVITVTLFRNP